MKTDLHLQRDILDELGWEPSVDAAEIGVTVEEGIVTLTGHANSYAEKLAAERATQRVGGVKAIANDIEVRLDHAGHRTDTDIAKSAAEALNWRVAVPQDQIKVSVTKGWITLEGTVDWQYQRKAAEDAVSTLLGVRGVLNELTVKPSATVAEVKSRIEAAFRRSAEVDAHSVTIETHGGTVILRGEVRSWAEHQEAERTAWAAPGVSMVKNHIVVAPYVTAY